MSRFELLDNCGTSAAPTMLPLGRQSRTTSLKNSWCRQSLATRLPRQLGGLRNEPSGNTAFGWCGSAILERTPLWPWSGGPDWRLA